ncbi:MAG TPA: hypothetical protein VEA78_00940 [Acidimicrobiales bacterium]|nr:hypothetical protein [Acidimicrobiales bacterium]
MEHIPDRYLNGQTARAITAPSAILLGGAAAAASIVAGLPIAAVVGLGALAYTARVALGLPRRARGERMDPFTLGEPWRQSVTDAQAAQRRFDSAVRQADSGPLRERLQEIGDRLEEGVKECWRIAQRGHLMAKGLKTLDVQDTMRDLARVERDLAEESDDRLLAARESLRSQLSSVQRMQDSVKDAQRQLRLLDARLDEAVTRAVELSLRSAGDADVSGLDSDVERLVSDMEALRAALEDVDAAGSAGAASAGA